MGLPCPALMEEEGGGSEQDQSRYLQEIKSCKRAAKRAELMLPLLLERAGTSGIPHLRMEGGVCCSPTSHRNAAPRGAAAGEQTFRDSNGCVPLPPAALPTVVFYLCQR